MSKAICVEIPVPPWLALQFPEVPGSGEPHVTLVYVGPGTGDDVAVVLRVVAEALPDLRNKIIVLGEVNYVDGLPATCVGSRAACVTAEVTRALRTARERLVDLLCEAGIDVQHRPIDDWQPHVTLAYLGEGEAYTGPVPRGGWTTDHVDVMHGSERYRVTSPAPLAVQPRTNANAIN